MERRVPDRTTLDRYLGEGLSQREIVEAWEKDSHVRVSRSAIAMAIERYGLRSVTPRPRYDDLLPWQVHKEHTMHRDARMLRLEARRRRGAELNAGERSNLEKWLAALESHNAVVAYDGETAQGFWWVRRTEEDGEDIIRRPE